MASILPSTDLATSSDDRAVLDDEFVDPVSKAQVDETAGGAIPNYFDERRDDAGASAPRDVESRHRIAGARGGVAAALGPADDGEEPDAVCAKPRSFLTSRELQVGLGPLARPIVFVAVEARGSGPVGAREFEAVMHAEAPLLGGVDQKDTAE
jgi:hypothetical protein